MARTSLITDSFTNFCACFQFRANQRKPAMLPYQPLNTQLLFSPLSASPHQQVPIMACIRSLPVFAPERFPTSLPAFKSRQVRWLTPLLWQIQNSLCFSHLAGLCLSLQSLHSLPSLCIVTFLSL